MRIILIKLPKATSSQPKQVDEGSSNVLNVEVKVDEFTTSL